MHLLLNYWFNSGKNTIIVCSAIWILYKRCMKLTVLNINSDINLTLFVVVSSEIVCYARIYIYSRLPSLFNNCYLYHIWLKMISFRNLFRIMKIEHWHEKCYQIDMWFIAIFNHHYDGRRPFVGLYTFI